MNREIRLYVVFCSIFCTIIITGNLIFQKFVTLHIVSYDIEVSVGVLLYPITFLISDLVTEFYGQGKAKFMVNIAVLCSLIVLVLIGISDYLSATSWSKIDDKLFHTVFNSYGIAAVASIIANYLGQICDITVYAYFKKLTNGKHLWLRNNLSTILGQLIDSVTVVTILCFFVVIPWSQFSIVIYSSFLFKFLAALADTPFCYLGHYLMSKKWEISK
ncbi:MAG: queuosine precursor transporter [Rickettsiaceae bacterium]|nr:queuosine precursor transporter [Rickettsiaceae bacterium]